MVNRASPRTYFVAAICAGALLIILLMSKKENHTVNQTAILQHLQDQIEHQAEVIQEWGNVHHAWSNGYIFVRWAVFIFEWNPVDYVI